MPSEVGKELEEAGVVLHPYFQVYEDVKKLDPSQKVMVERCLHKLYSL